MRGRPKKLSHEAITKYIKDKGYIVIKYMKGGIAYFLERNDADIAAELSTIYGKSINRNQIVYWRRKHGIGPAGLNWGGQRLTDYASGYDAVKRNQNGDALKLSREKGNFAIPAQMGVSIEPEETGNEVLDIFQDETKITDRIRKQHALRSIENQKGVGFLENIAIGACVLFALYIVIS